MTDDKTDNKIAGAPMLPYAPENPWRTDDLPHSAVYEFLAHDDHTHTFFVADPDKFNVGKLTGFKAWRPGTLTAHGKNGTSKVWHTKEELAAWRRLVKS